MGFVVGFFVDGRATLPVHPSVRERGLRMPWLGSVAGVLEDRNFVRPDVSTAPR